VLLEFEMTQHLQLLFSNHGHTIIDLKLLIDLMASYAESHAI
jgi:hypothetical protein